MSRAARDREWAAEEAEYWRLHQPAYVQRQQRTQPLPGSAFPLGQRFAVGATADPLPPVVDVVTPPVPLAEPPEEAAPRWTCSECGGPRQSQRSHKCQACLARAANAARYRDPATPARWARPVEPPAPEPVVAPPALCCPQCGQPSTTGKRCNACANVASWAAKPHPAPAARPTCADCHVTVARPGNRCRRCAQRRLHPPRPVAVPGPLAAPLALLCGDCGAPVSRPGLRCRRCAGARRSQAAAAGRAAGGTPGRVSAPCRNCGSGRPIVARGVCATCYDKVRHGTLPESVLAARLRDQTLLAPPPPRSCPECGRASKSGKRCQSCAMRACRATQRAARAAATAGAPDPLELVDVPLVVGRRGHLVSQTMRLAVAGTVASVTDLVDFLKAADR